MKSQPYSNDRDQQVLPQKVLFVVGGHVGCLEAEKQSGGETCRMYISGFGWQVRHIFKSHLCDAIETANERIQRVEETQKVVQAPDEPEVIVAEQVSQRGRDHGHLRQSKEKIMRERD